MTSQVHAVVDHAVGHVTEEEVDTGHGHLTDAEDALKDQTGWIGGSQGQGHHGDGVPVHHTVEIDREAHQDEGEADLELHPDAGGRELLHKAVIARGGKAQLHEAHHIKANLDPDSLLRFR